MSGEGGRNFGPIEDFGGMISNNYWDEVWDVFNTKNNFYNVFGKNGYQKIPQKCIILKGKNFMFRVPHVCTYC